MEIGKRYYFSDHGNSCQKNKTRHQKHESYTFEVLLLKLS